MKKLLLLAAILISSSEAVWAQPSGPPIVGVADLNGLAITLVKPAFPDSSLAAGADGSAVIVRVVVDENGNPLSAVCSTTCHPMLKDAAELAAMTSKFKPQMVDGRPVRFTGTLSFTYVVSNVNWVRFGTSIESTVQFDNLSLGPVAQVLSNEYAAERARLLTLDEEGVTFGTRQRVMAEVIASIKSKLKGADLWRFETSMALRRISFWTMAREKTDRVAMQKAIDDLAGRVTLVPEGTSAAVIAGITALSKYRVTPEIPERDLRTAISELSRKIPYELR